MSKRGDARRVIQCERPSPSSSRQQQQPPFYSHYTGQLALAGTSSQELDFVGEKFYCQHAPADGNQCIRMPDKTLEFSSTVLSTLSPYLTTQTESETPVFPESICVCTSSKT